MWPENGPRQLFSGKVIRAFDGNAAQKPFFFQCSTGSRKGVPVEMPGPLKRGDPFFHGLCLKPVNEVHTDILKTGGSQMFEGIFSGLG
jgi:hypothetical protein